MLIIMLVLFQATGEALAMVFSGEYNPGGRLPFTWPVSIEEVRANNYY